MRRSDTFDVVIIGGGLAGLVAAYSLSRTSKTVAVIDVPPVNSATGLGGFAPFSGAKFSLPPAGLGLSHLTGGEASLRAYALEVLQFLGLADVPPRNEGDFKFDESTGRSVALRSYESLVISPSQMKALLSRLHERVGPVTRLISGRCTSLRKAENSWEVVAELTDGNRALLLAKDVIYAGGRSDSSLLRNAGAVVVEGKGLDVGFRVDFADKIALRRLRDLGPDAKLFHGNCRTFCLNYPGSVYRYNFAGFGIPGGVVAEEPHPNANVGFLRRSHKKGALLERVRTSLGPIQSAYPSLVISSNSIAPVAAVKICESLYGEEISSELWEFCRWLEHVGLIDWKVRHDIHFPLIDWHWDVFAQPDTLATSVQGLYVIGDSAGHARGLLQAAITGWICPQFIRSQ